MQTESVMRRQGFTLIELLIVIGLLGALTALILPSLSADRKEALQDVNKYNKAGTMRVLSEYHQLTNGYPSGMHTGLQAASGDEAVRMVGMPKCTKKNVTSSTITTLTATQLESLAEAGIESLCYGTGLNKATLDETVCVVKSADWVRGSNQTALTFQGLTGAEWAATMNSDPNGGGTDGLLIALWVAPTTDWESASGGNNDWTRGNVELGVDMPAQAPIPTVSADGDDVDIEFAYYVGHFLVDSDATDGVQAAELVGVTCPGGGALNP